MTDDLKDKIIQALQRKRKSTSGAAGTILKQATFKTTYYPYGNPDPLPAYGSFSWDEIRRCKPQMFKAKFQFYFLPTLIKGISSN